MTQAQKYVRATDFSDEELANVGGRSTVRTAAVDAELDAVGVSLNRAIVNQILNQRDDGEIRDGRVKLFTLASDVLALLTQYGAVPRGVWLTTTLYAVKDLVTQGGNTYIAVTLHTSGVFATDLAAGKWLLFSLSATPSATAVTFTPTATLVATNTQAAIEETDTENRALSTSLVESFDAALRADLSDQLVAAKNSGQIGFAYALTYAAGTIGRWLQDLALATGSTFIGWIAAGAGAVLRSISDKFLDEVWITDYMSAAQKADMRSFGGTLDLSSAWAVAQSALIAAGGGTLRLPAGAFRLNSTVAASSSKSIRVLGAGMGSTIIYKYNDSDALTYTAIGGSPQFEFEEFSIVPMTAMSTGAAISTRDDGVLPSIRARNVFIGGGTLEFKRGWKLVNCTEAQFTGCVTYGFNNASFMGYDLSSTVAATVPKWFGCSSYNHLTAVNVTGSANPGIEGVQFYGCDFVGGNGVVYLNTAGYVPPQITWIGGHINSSLKNFDLTKVGQITISQALLYNSAAASQILNFTNCGDLNIHGNLFYQLSGAADGIAMSASSTTNGGLIKNNRFSISSSKACVNLVATNFQNLEISGNTSIGGGAVVAVSGTLDPSVRIFMNTPKDADDAFKAVTITGTSPNAVIPLAGVRNEALVLLSPGSATTVATMTGGSLGDVRQVEGNTNLTIAHNGINPNGFSLRGAANHTFLAGEVLTFKLANGGFWTQI